MLLYMAWRWAVHCDRRSREKWVRSKNLGS
jgi:hypothetical protein